MKTQRYTYISVFLCFVTFVLSQNCRPDAPRSLDGTCNNLQNSKWGAAGEGYLVEPGEYDIDAPNGRPNVRTVSRELFFYPMELTKDEFRWNAAQRKTGIFPDKHRRNSWWVTMGQFITHDCTRNTVRQGGTNRFRIFIEDHAKASDPLFNNPNGTTDLIWFESEAVPTTNGQFISKNGATSYLDLDLVYGQTEADKVFRKGRHLVHEDNDLPTKLEGITSGCENGALAPDLFRVEENIQLVAIHTMYLRLHNLYADMIKKAHPDWSEEAIFEEARALNIAEYQHMIIDEWLPLCIGPRAYTMGMKPYRGYNAKVNPSVSDEFAGGAYRVLHDMVLTPFLILDDKCVSKSNGEGNSLGTENTNCQFQFLKQVKVESVVRGAVEQYGQEMGDLKFVNSLVNGVIPTQNGIDIESITLMRGREHQLKSYNYMREKWTGRDIYRFPTCNTEKLAEDSEACFNIITKDKQAARKLKQLYKKVSKIDAYVGLTIEDITPATYMIGPTAAHIIMDQFDRLRAGDRYWYENIYHPRVVEKIKKVTIADQMRRVFPGVKLNDNAFLVQEHCGIKYSKGNPKI